LDDAETVDVVLLPVGVTVKV
jgi:hypothetical protein